MTPKDAIKNTLEMGNQVLMAYLGDLEDADLMIRSQPGVNHIAWQLGHLITSENEMLSGVGLKMPPLPDGFGACYTKETSTSDDAAKFHTKAQYLAALAEQRKGTLAALESASDADLDKPTPEVMHAFAKTVGVLFNLIGVHGLMHVGQFVPVRRLRGKPVTI